jgi:putative heme transporter
LDTINRGGPASSARPDRAPPNRRRQVIRSALSIALVVAIFFGVLPRVADFSEVWEHIDDMTLLEVGSLLLFAVWNLLTYTFVLMAVLPGLTAGQGVVVSQSSTAIANTVPAGAGFGIGVSWAMYSSWGFGRSAITLAVLLSGIWAIFIKLGLPVVALAFVVLGSGASGSDVVAALAGLATLAFSILVFALVLRSEHMARRLGDAAGRALSRVRRLVRKPPVTGLGDATVEFRDSTVGLLRRRWVPLTLATVVSHVSLFVVLLLAMRHVGVSEDEVNWAEVLAAFAFVRLISALPLTPGGLGVVELGLTAGLAASGGDREQVVAAILVFRGLTYLLPIPLGALTYVVWRRKTAWRAVPPERAPNPAERPV